MKNQIGLAGEQDRNFRLTLFHKFLPAISEPCGVELFLSSS
jgi:hypothetical protein